MKELEQYRKYMNSLPDGILQAEAEAEKNDILSVEIVDGEDGGMSASDRTAIFVRVSGEKTGMTYTQNLEADPVSVMMEALRNSEYGKELKEEKMNQLNAQNPESRHHFGTMNVMQNMNNIEIMNNIEFINNIEKMNDFEDETAEHISFIGLTDFAKKLEAEIKSCSDDFSHISVHVAERLKTVGIVNSSGLDKTYTKRIAEASVSITCEGETHRSLELETSASAVQKISVIYFVEQIKRWLVFPQKETVLKKNEYEAVIDATVLCNILLTVWQMFSGVNYLGRNTPVYSRLGEQLFSKEVTLSDMPIVSESGYGRAFDCEGTECKQVDVVREGQFCGLLHNLRTAELLDTNPTGNAGRDISLIMDQTETKAIPSNFILAKGTHKKEELLTELNDGIYISESFDMFHSINLASGEFAIPCIGIVYENGQATGIAKGLTMSGNVLDLLGNVTKVADDYATFSLVMSKSYQVMASTVLVSKLKVTG